MTKRCGLFAGVLAYLLWSADQAKAVILVEYEFAENECQEGVFKDVAGGDRYFGDLIMDNSTTSCLQGVGVERNSASPGTPGASSVGNASMLIQDLFRDDSPSPGVFSLELWLNIGSLPPCEYGCTSPVVTFGKRGGNDILDSECQENIGLMIKYWTGDGFFGARVQSSRDICERFWSGANQADNIGYPLHLVLTIAPREYFNEPYAYFEWFINGTRVAWDLSKHVPPEVLVKLWDPGFNLQILDRGREYPSSLFSPAPGIRFFFLAIHNETLLEPEVRSRYSAGILNSNPVVFDAIVGIAEDGEAGDHYETPEAYLQGFPESELQSIPLAYYDSDSDPTTPNFDNVTNPRMFISRLPLIGHLVNESGEDVVSVPFEVIPEDGIVFNVKFRPVFNNYSTNVTSLLGTYSTNVTNSTGNDPAVYANFTYYAVDRLTQRRSPSNATISIIVVSKNDPPEAFRNASHDAIAGTRQNIISMHGQDLEAYDYVRAVGIEDHPPGGALFQVRHIPFSLKLVPSSAMFWI